jgi:hypothetical protein
LRGDPLPFELPDRSAGRHISNRAWPHALLQGRFLQAAPLQLRFGKRDRLATWWIFNVHSGLKV